MKLTCPQCQTELQLDPVVVPEQGMAVSCYQCLHTFQLSLSSGAQGQPQVSVEPQEAQALVDATRDSFEEIDFSQLSPQAPAERAFPEPLDVGAALFGGGESFGFELPEGSSSTFAAIPPPGAEERSTPEPPLTPVSPPVAPARPSRPLRPRRPDASLNADLPRPSARKLPPKAFNSPELEASPAPPRMEAVFVEEAPAQEPHASGFSGASSSAGSYPQGDELFAVQSTPAQGDELFAIQSTPAQGDELFAVQGAPAQGDELFAVQGAPAQGDELFAVQSAPAQGDELFAVQSTPAQGDELFALQSAPINSELFAVQSGGDQGLEALFNAPSSSSALGEFSADADAEMDLFSRGADALFELEAPSAPTPVAPRAPEPVVSPQSFELPSSFSLPGVEPPPPPTPPPLPLASPAQPITPIDPGSAVEPVEVDSLEELIGSPLEDKAQESDAPPPAPQPESKSRAVSPLLLVALLLVGALGGLHSYDPQLLPGLLGLSDPAPVARRSPNLKELNQRQRAPEAVALPTSGPVAPKQPSPAQPETAPKATNVPTGVTLNSASPSATSAQAGWHALAPSLRERLSTQAVRSPEHAQLGEVSALDSEGYRQVANVEATPSAQAARLARGALYFPHEPSWSREAGALLNSLDSEARRAEDAVKASLANALSQRLKRSQEHAIAYGLTQPDDPDAQELLGHAFLARGQTALAAGAFERALQLDPNRPLLRLRHAELLLANGNTDEAERAYQALRKDGHDNDAVRRGLAMIEVKKQNTKQAFTWINALFEQPKERFKPHDKALNLITLAQVLDLDQNQAQAKGETRGDETLIEREVARNEALKNAVKSWPDHMPALSMLFEPMREANQAREALKQLDALTKETGASHAIAALHAKLLLDVDREAKALETLQEAVRAHPNSYEAHEALGRELMRRKEFVGAREAFERASSLTSSPEDSELLFSELLIKEARVDEAQALLERAIKRRPWSPKLRRGLADLKLKIGLRNGQARLIRESYESFDRVLMLHPGDHHARLQRARAAISLGRAQESLDDLNKLMGEPELRGRLDFELGEAKMALKKDKDARLHFNKVLKREPSNLQALRAMGQLYQRDGDDAQAKRSLEQALAVNTRDSVTRYELGRLSLKTEANQEAIDHLRIAAESKLQDPQVQYWFGRALERSEDRKVSGEARAVYENTARLIQELDEVPKELCDVHYRVGKIHSKNASELSRALDDFMRASECDPSRADIWTELGTQYDRLGDQKQALAYYQDALKRDKSFAPAQLGVARAHLRSRPPQTTKAKAILEQLAKRAPLLPEPHYLLCKIYQFKSKKRAQKTCRSYIQAAPDGEFAREVREILKSL